MSKFPAILTPALSLIFAFVLVACGGGSETIANPNLGSTSNLAYNGPPAATDDVRAFQINLWDNLKAANRCGQCHGAGQAPTFANPNDINSAYAQAVPIVDLLVPSKSLMATKVGGGHNCWLTSTVACFDSIEQMISNWAGNSGASTARVIPLTAPVIKDPGNSKTFPALATDNASNSFADTIHPILTARCQGCHDDSVSLPIAPFFANADVNTAYEAAKPKIDIDTPANSRLVVRLRDEFHNCWTDCASNATTMLAAIQAFADQITPTSVDPTLITSKALSISDGILATGGNRHESNLIAIWEFKAGSGPTAFDTSGIEPAINLTLSGSTTWLGGFGIDFTGGRAQGNTGDSKKLHDFIRSSGEYAIEAWVIPANVTQEDANIVSYSAGATNRNFTLGQALYNYQFYNRSGASDNNGVAFLATPDAAEVLQSSLQHVVVNYHPVSGRSIFVNGNAISVTDPVTVPTTIANWDDGFAFVLGNEVGNVNRTWNGKLRMVAIHNRTLSATQALQNFNVGVGEKFFLLFSIADRIAIPDSYIMFEVSQFDSYAYLFQKPVFVNLNSNWTPVAVDIQGMRIGINGKEAVAGQAYANLNATISSGQYTVQSGQLLSSLGAVIALEKGSANDEFFLTFEKLGSNTRSFSDPIPGTPSAGPDAAKVSDIGVRTFEEINASIATITGIPVTNSAIVTVYNQYRQQLPSVETIDAFLPSHQMAIAQLALTSCSELVKADIALANPASQYFTNFDFSATAGSAFDTVTKRNQVLDPLLAAAMNLNNGVNNLTSQPVEAEIRDMLSATTTQDLDSALTGDSYSSLMTEMQTCLATCNTTTRTDQIVKAVCAAAVGGAVMLIQ